LEICHILRYKRLEFGQKAKKSVNAICSAVYAQIGRREKESSLGVWSL